MNFDLTPEEANLALKGLSLLPYHEVNKVIDKIWNQGQVQLTVPSPTNESTEATKPELLNE